MYPPPHPHPYGFTPAPSVRRWWHHPALIVTALVLLPPAGIVLAWTSRWSRGKKIVATVLSGLWFLLFLVTDPPEKPDDAKALPVAAPAATPPASSSPAPPSPPSPSPSAPDEPRMPSVVGKSFAEAEKAVQDGGGTGLSALSAYRDVALATPHADWTVCLQGLSPGSPIAARLAAPTVHLAARGTPCPTREGTDLRPSPAPVPTPTPTPPPPPQPPQDESDDGGSTASGGAGDGDSDSSTPVKRAGSFCAPAGAVAVTSAGTPLVCGPGSDGRNRWRRG
ncbi:hypothetical protein [Streptomyces sp. NPDC058701]|uniref:hypothetical protein n=1 Tax=Streptomyces sp. NPDC058701 TaxID=3346608 RepID=UPI003645F8AE